MDVIEGCLVTVDDNSGCRGTSNEMAKGRKNTLTDTNVSSVGLIMGRWPGTSPT
ncbi:hypothetical protein QJS10_CPB11g01334 [Acorus calamus]|uniref:Uncharacterized protein n=1 Tax=Acorus calamus TaxID=4465 RepID=A0AAV9DU81_ACOCL|nr:hypothetical protein QJS10_CPB11g01334 [Acorus calamus]